MQLERKLSGCLEAAGAASAGLLAFLLSVLLVLSASPSIHQHLHHDGTNGHHLCLGCTFAKGQVSTADVAPAAVLILLFLICRAQLPGTASFSASDYRLAPSRAPPRF